LTRGFLGQRVGRVVVAAAAEGDYCGDRGRETPDQSAERSDSAAAAPFLAGGLVTLVALHLRGRCSQPAKVASSSRAPA